MSFDLSKLFLDPSTMFCLAAADRSEGRINIIGSASMVMPGVFLTASHVVEEWLKLHDPRVDVRSVDSEQFFTFEIDLLQPLVNHDEFVWHVDSPLDRQGGAP